MNFRFRHLAAVTTALTFVLILLGLHTGSTGGGLSCGARWPLCNGWLGLFPADWASFFEWFHRFVAMIVGFLLLGVLYGVWRWQDDRRVRYSVTVALAVLPAQIVLGGVTTTAGGLFPQGFNPVVMFAHFTTATVIFLLLVYATVRLYDVPPSGPVRRLATSTVGIVTLGAVFDLIQPFSYQPANQAGYYAASFALLAALITLLVCSGRAIDAPSRLRFRALTASATAVLYVDMVLSRRLFGTDPFVGDVTTVLLGLATLGVAFVASRAFVTADGIRSQRAD